MLRTALDRPRSVLVRVAGLPGAGTSTLVRRACRDLASLYLACPPLPDPDQRALLDRLLNARLGERDEGARTPHGPDPPGWSALVERLADHAAAQGRAHVLVLDDAHRLAEARARIGTALAALLRSDALRTAPLHVVLTGRSGGMPSLPDLDPDRLVDVPVGPLPFRAAEPLLPGSGPRDRLLSYAVFGGMPATLRHVHVEVGLSTNLRRTLLDPEGPLRDHGLALLERALQTPARYAAILRSLADGETDWGTVHRGVRDLTASGQVAPYLKRLEALGMVESRRSLDAKPTGRSRRYRITDPGLAFWYRFILPHRAALSEGAGIDVWSDTIRPGLDDHAASIFSGVCRQFMEQDAIELIGSNGREVGSLWGPDYEVPVAGTLSSGGAFYGVAPWTDPATPPTLADLDRNVRETRYGFGRERRLRIVFSPHAFPTDLQREVARRDDAILVGADLLTGGS